MLNGSPAQLMKRSQGLNPLRVQQARRGILFRVGQEIVGFAD
jgi:hypothetical protein